MIDPDDLPIDPEEPVRPIPAMRGTPVMRIRFNPEAGVVTYEPMPLSGGGIRRVPRIPSASLWMVPIAAAARQP